MKKSIKFYDTKFVRAIIIKKLVEKQIISNSHNLVDLKLKNITLTE